VPVRPDLGLESPGLGLEGPGLGLANLALTASLYSNLVYASDNWQSNQDEWF